ncbi:MAG: hypothetical protein Alis3KO_23850 [Aliiglaciecola sp.]
MNKYKYKSSAVLMSYTILLPILLFSIFLIYSNDGLIGEEFGRLRFSWALVIILPIVIVVSHISDRYTKGAYLGISDEFIGVFKKHETIRFYWADIEVIRFQKHSNKIVLELKRSRKLILPQYEIPLKNYRVDFEELKTLIGKYGKKIKVERL